MVAGLTLVCPVRGRLKAKSRSADGLTPSEERFRVEMLRHLIDRGYPKENILVEAVIKRFGNSGRNSFRADVAVLDVPLNTLPDGDVDTLLQHAVVLGEVKRDHNDSAAAKSYQVKPLIDFARRDDCVALYWDDVEHRVYWNSRSGGAKVPHEGPLTDLPGFKQKPGATPLTYASISSDRALLTIFKRIEDVLHSASLGPSRRFKVMLQLLLAKLHDEHDHAGSPESALALQDFAALGVDAVTAKSVVDGVVRSAVDYYQHFLPEPVDRSLPVSGETLLEVMRLLAPIKIVSMAHSVIQDFYMYFAKHIYKWDLAQYFTPTNLTDFIVEVLNPRKHEHVRDPACGSADFLTAAFRRGHSQGWHDYASSIGGSDVSSEAVQVAVLNMILNGDGKTNIREEDSLLKIASNESSCNIVICNPPFGTRINERNPQIVSSFDLGHEWIQDNAKRWQKTDRRLDKQESGLLFAEACARMVRPGGRFALVVPNGYLSNRSQRYAVLREWILRHCRIAVAVGLPRFAFASSGASVAATIIFCERREVPLAHSEESEDYELCVEIVDRVGWRLGDKRGEPVFRRDTEDGTYLLDENDDQILDSDFGATLGRIRNSDAAQYFPWLSKGLAPDSIGSDYGWCVPISDVLSDELRTLDPKSLSQKLRNVRTEIAAVEHFALGDAVDFMAESFSSAGDRMKIDPAKVYRYIQIDDVSVGMYRWQSMRGWELPSRGKHHAEAGDIYIGSIWSCVSKWFMMPVDNVDAVVTNGFLRLRLKEGSEHRLLDLVAGLCSEAFATQMRGFARGSDGLAEIGASDAARIVLPVVGDDAVRDELRPFVEQLVSGNASIEAKVAGLRPPELGATSRLSPASPPAALPEAAQRPELIVQQEFVFADQEFLLDDQLRVRIGTVQVWQPARLRSEPHRVSGSVRSRMSWSVRRGAVTAGGLGLLKQKRLPLPEPPIRPHHTSIV